MNQWLPRNPFVSPRFGQIATFMLLPAAPSPDGLDVALLGIPYDGGTSYRPGARFGPRAVREQSSLIRSWHPVLKVLPFERLRVADCGDVDVIPISIEETYGAVSRRIDDVNAAGAIPLCVGGDHSVTLPILRSLARRHGPVGVVHFDAHPDTWDEYFGHKFFHGTPFRRAVEEGVVDPTRFIQIGIRGPLYGPEDFAFHDERGIEAIRIEAVKERGVAWAVARLERLCGGPVYCSFDIDAVDPAYAPATGTPEVGGLSSYEALCLVRGLQGLHLVGADIVEVAPPYDGPGQITALLAANLMFELVCQFALGAMTGTRQLGAALVGLLATALHGGLVAHATPRGPHVDILTIDGVISPVTVRLVESGIERARAEGAQALVIRLDTPGGLERSMRSIAQRILNAEVPVVVYVSPTGARAASAGVFITLAGHVAAMAPATNIGAAHPVAVGGNVDKESLRKIENDAAAFIRSLALERGRNADWAEKAVRESVSATEREALKLRVIDLVADSVPDLLEKIDGRTVKTARGQITLATRRAEMVPVEVGLRDRFLNVITDPNVAYILMMMGVLGLFFELSNPGVIVPGVIGGISLILAFYAFQSLPINFAGLLLILLGIVLLVAEIKIVSHGVLAIGGVIAMALGSLMLFDAPEVNFRLSRWLLVATVGVVAAGFLITMTAGARALRRPPMLGARGMIGATGVARGALAPRGEVHVGGELWRAVAEGGHVEDGRPVRVVNIEGLTLRVVKVDNGGGAS